MASLKMLPEVVADIRVAQLRSEAARAARAAAQQLQVGVDEVLPPTMPALHREGVLRQAEVFGTAAERQVRTGVDSATAQGPESPSRGR
ncbi:MAG TPA: hypothetical protein VHL54_02745 [Actinomycetota bacterium]|jgi:hypothetical protein|nr:hypothetical protein [Actinomycetota bacterium]